MISDPLSFLDRARGEFGDVFVIREEGPIFSRSKDCNGVVAVFGSRNLRQILSDVDSFSMPISASQKLALPPSLANLNRGLHSMLEPDHGTQKRLVMGLLSQAHRDSRREEIRACVQEFVREWKDGNEIALLDDMRRLTLNVATRRLFGPTSPENMRLSTLLHAYFGLRREASSPFDLASTEVMRELVDVGHQVDGLLRQRIRQYRKLGRSMHGPILQRLAVAGITDGTCLSEDEVVGHTNVLFVSSTEPTAVSLTWILLVLSQVPDLRRRISESLIHFGDESARHTRTSSVDNVISETMRLLTPNALMVRLTSRSVSLGGITLPPHSEIVLCPFLVHRESTTFPDPHVFLPSRWDSARPSAYEYLPFGAGGHVCAGQSDAMSLIRETLTTILGGHEIVMTCSQSVDWCIKIMLMPRANPAMTVHRIEAARHPPSPRWYGPVSELIQFNGDVLDTR
jgi:cytochrome P450